VDDPRVDDRVADSLCIADKTESENLLFGQSFGIGPDILTGPNGNLFVVSGSNGAISCTRKKYWSSDPCAAPYGKLTGGRKISGAFSSLNSYAKNRHANRRQQLIGKAG
jgi:hypothetical protein